MTRGFESGGWWPKYHIPKPAIPPKETFATCEAVCDSMLARAMAWMSVVIRTMSKEEHGLASKRLTQVLMFTMFKQMANDYAGFAIQGSAEYENIGGCADVWIGVTRDKSYVDANTQRTMAEERKEEHETTPKTMQLDSASLIMEMNHSKLSHFSGKTTPDRVSIMTDTQLTQLQFKCKEHWENGGERLESELRNALDQARQYEVKDWPNARKLAVWIVGPRIITSDALPPQH